MRFVKKLLKESTIMKKNQNKTLTYFILCLLETSN